MSDPDDTIPPAPQPAPRPLPSPATLEELGAILIDRRSRLLARACAGWALREYAIEDLVGVVFDCTCATRVFPRVELAQKYAAGPVRRALDSARPQRGRLTVVAHTDDGCVTYGAHLPRDVDAPDIEAPLQPLSAARRAWLDEYLGELPFAMRRGILPAGRHVEDTIVRRTQPPGSCVARDAATSRRSKRAGVRQRQGRTVQFGLNTPGRDASKRHDGSLLRSAPAARRSPRRSASARSGRLRIEQLERGA